MVVSPVMPPILVLLLIGATVRLTRLLTVDYLFESVRQRIQSALPTKVAYLVRCDWCMSMYVGAAVFVAGWYGPDTGVLIVAGALTASLAAGWSSAAEAALESASERGEVAIELTGGSSNG